jgi:hypothetical protein
MLWPVPVNVRMSPILANQLLDINAQCANEEREIFDFPEYATTLNEGQTIRLQAIAAEIIRSFGTQSPIAGVSIIGHADRALKEPKDKRSKKEQQVSDDRAKNAEKQLRAMLGKMPGGGPPLAMVQMKAVGNGSKELKIKEPINEEQMKKNRRVVIKWSRCLVPQPIIHPPLDFPPRPNGDPADDPNTVFAGHRFRMRILDGVSAGEIGGIYNYHLEIWDIDNNRSAEYLYSGVIGTVGIPPFTECGQTDWSRVFDTGSHVQVDQLSGEGSHISGSAVLVSGMRYTFESFKDATVKMPVDEATVNIFAGPAKSFGAETTVINGSRTIIRGSVKVFKGP